MSQTQDARVAPSRREFVRKSAAAAVVLPAIMAGLSSCAETRAARVSGTTADTLPPTDPALARRGKAEAMDAMHEKGVKAFLAKSEGKDNQLMAPRMEGRVKVYDLTAEEI